jgi:hypothetical protein
MKRLTLLITVIVVAVACNSNKKTENAEVASENVEMAFTSLGEKITADNVLSKEEIIEKYKNLKPGDSVAVKFTSEVKEVCQNKGCWMKMDMGEDQAMVRFKDYGFFMPKDLAGQTVIVEGYAFVEEMSVEDQKHYAEDAGKSPEEIAAITTPKRTLSFVSNGVLIPELDMEIENQ